jgi:hypothetical protein
MYKAVGILKGKYERFDLRLYVVWDFQREEKEESWSASAIACFYMRAVSFTLERERGVMFFTSYLHVFAAGSW